MTPRTLVMIASLALSLITGVVLSRGRAGNGADAGRAGPPVIGLSLDTLKEARWQADRDLFVARAEALGAKVLVQAAQSDDARQIADVEALLSRRIDALVIVPHDGRAMAKAVRLAHAAGVPVVSYDRLIRDESPDLYLSFDNVRVGALQARWLLAHRPSGRPLRLVRVYGSRSDNNAVMLKQGQDEALGPEIDAGRVVVVHEDWAEDWKPENGKKIVNAAITRAGRELDAVLASNDGTAGGAVQALAEEGLAGKVLVTGQDAELVACQRLVAGTQAMTVYKPIAVLAGRAAEAAVRLARHQVVVAPTTVPNGVGDVPAILAEVVAVTRDNLRETVIKDGFQTEAAVYGGAARP